MKKEIKEKLMRFSACESRKNVVGQQTTANGFWTVRYGMNHPLMYRQLLVRYLIAFCVLLALLLTLAFYIRKGRHLHVSPQADMPEWVAGEYEKYSPEGEQI